jgi:hypothetical protein
MFFAAWSGDHREEEEQNEKSERGRAPDERLARSGSSLTAVCLI